MEVPRAALTNLADEVASNQGTSVAVDAGSVSRIPDLVVAHFNIAEY